MFSSSYNIINFHYIASLVRKIRKEHWGGNISIFNRSFLTSSKYKDCEICFSSRITHLTKFGKLVYIFFSVPIMLVNVGRVLIEAK